VKFELKDFRSVKALARSIEMMKKIILESLDDLIAIQLLFDRSKRAFDQLKGTLDQSKLVKLSFLQTFLITILNV